MFDPQVFGATIDDAPAAKACACACGCGDGAGGGSGGGSWYFNGVSNKFYVL